MLANISEMPEVPSYEIVDLVKRRRREVNRIGDIFAVKDAALDVPFSEYRDLLGDLDLFERFDEI